MPGVPRVDAPRCKLFTKPRILGEKTAHQRRSKRTEVDPHVKDRKTRIAASIVGLVLAVVGFVVTIIGVWKSKSAAERAASAAAQARDNMIVLHTVDDFATAVAAMEEIKRLHRADAWVVLPDRYSDLRKRLVMLRATYGELSELDRAVIQGTVQHLVTLETKVERAIAAGAAPSNVPKMNEIVSQQLDKLTELLAIVKARPRS